MLIGLLFVTLAADVRYEQVRELGVPGLLVVAALVVVVRPLGVWLSTLGSDLSVRVNWRSGSTNHSRNSARRDRPHGCRGRGRQSGRGSCRN